MQLFRLWPDVWLSSFHFITFRSDGSKSSNRGVADQWNNQIFTGGRGGRWMQPTFLFIRGNRLSNRKWWLVRFSYWLVCNSVLGLLLPGWAEMTGFHFKVVFLYRTQSLEAQRWCTLYALCSPLCPGNGCLILFILGDRRTRWCSFISLFRSNLPIFYA